MGSNSAAKHTQKGNSMSKSTKTFTYVGVSQYKGKVKVRYTNNLAARIKIMNKGHKGHVHTNIEFTELLRPMTKEEIVKEGFHQAALDSYMKSNIEAVA